MPVDEGHRRAGRDAFCRAGGVVEGVGGLVLRGDDAHAGIRVKDDGAFLHDDEIVVISAFGRVQIQIDIQRMVVIEPLVLKYDAFFAGSRLDAQAKREGKHKQQ